MESITCKFDAEAKVLVFEQNEYNVDDDSDIELYFSYVFAPPPGVKVMGGAVLCGIDKIINFRCLHEFKRAFDCMHVNHREINMCFMSACAYANIPVAEYLLTLGANVNYEDAIDETSVVNCLFSRLHYKRNDPAFIQRHFAMWRFLLEKKEFNPLVSTPDGDAWSLVWGDVDFPHDIIESFLKRGADPDFLHEDDGRVPLCLAAEMNDFALVQLLCRYRANPYALDFMNKMPRDYTEDPEIRGFLHMYNPYLQVFYCLQHLGIDIDADSSVDLINYFPEYHAVPEVVEDEDGEEFHFDLNHYAELGHQMGLHLVEPPPQPVPEAAPLLPKKVDDSLPWHRKDHKEARNRMVIFLLGYFAPKLKPHPVFYENLPKMARRAEKDLYFKAKDFVEYSELFTVRTRLHQIVEESRKSSA